VSNEAEQRERAELLARCLDDYPTFCRALIWVIPKGGQRRRLRFKQAQATYDANRSWRDVVLKGRQVGMTTEGVARDVYKFVSQPGQRVVIVVQSITGNPALRQVSAMVRVMLDGLRQSGVRLDLGTDSESLWTLPSRDSRLQIIEAGASLAAAQKKGRGGTYSRVHITEAAFFEHPEATTNALFEGVPAIDGTEIEVESTANGTGNWFHGLWVGAVAGANGFKPHFIPWFEDESCVAPLLDGEYVEPTGDFEEHLVTAHQVRPDQLKWYRAKVALKGAELTRQEYPSDPITAFLTSGRSYFDREKLDEMAQNVRPPIRESRDGLRIWADRKADSKYVIGVDPAEGLGEDGDWSYATVWERATRVHVATLRNKLQANPFADMLAELGTAYGNALIAVERNKGLALIRALERIGYERLYEDDDGKPGIATTSTTRPVMLEELADAIRDESMHTNDPVLIEEMRAFVTNPRDGKPYAPGKHRKNGVGDDGIFSAAMARRAMLRPDVTATAVVTGERGGFGEGPWRDARGF
jgi:hypothetical protein